MIVSNNLKLNILLLVLIGLCSSCNDWLNINPRTEKIADEYFEEEQGFWEALNGVYIQLKDPSIYGENLTMGKIEHLVSFYDAKNSQDVKNMNSHNYTASMFEDVYAGLYRVIASCNNILQYVDKNKGVFSNDTVYALVKGECLGIRALCHFDLLRLFGQAPLQMDMAMKVLPYVTKLGKKMNLPISQKEYIEKLRKDFIESEQLLTCDPIIGSEIISYRNTHLNYFALKALQARFHLYLNEKEAANKAALEVLKNESFRLGNNADQMNKDFLFSSEHIFALNDFKLKERYEERFLSKQFCKGNDFSMVKDDMYFHSGTDIREPKIGLVWTLISGGETLPYVITQKYAGGFNDNIPIIRLSEIYFIYIETVEDMEMANKYWKQFLFSRNVAEESLTLENMRERLVEEYRKEFYAEGVMFYTHKRLNSNPEEILWFPLGVDVNYMIELPESEIKDSNN